MLNFKICRPAGGVVRPAGGARRAGPAGRAVVPRVRRPGGRRRLVQGHHAARPQRTAVKFKLDYCHLCYAELYSLVLRR